MYYDEKDYYEILQVSQNASAEVIEAAYRRLAETFHPDNGGTEEYFKLINKAYEVLGNPDFKEDYDNWRHIGATYDQYNAWESTPDNSFYSNVSSEAPQIRPWVRYFAKLFDLYVSSIATGLILGICFPQILNLSDLVLNIIAFLIFPFYEAFFLSLFGTTPGKWLLSTSVSNKQQQPLSFLDALTRGYKVVIKGLGLGIPIVILVTGFYQYKMLKENGINSWDAEKSHVVLHDHLNPLKVIILVVLFIFIIWLMSFSM